MKNFLMNILVSGVVAAATVVLINKYDAAILDVHSEQQSLLSHADNEMGKLMKTVAELSMTQSDIRDHLTDMELTIQTMESSFQDASANLWEEIARNQKPRVDPSDIPVDSNTVHVAQTREKDVELNNNNEQEPQDSTPEEHIAKMDAVFYAQEADQTWDDMAREQIYANYMSAMPSEIQLQDLSCAGVMCRLEVLQEAGIHMDEYTSHGEPLVPWDHRAKAATIQNSDGSMITVMYISREGYKMPGLESEEEIGD